MIRKTSIAITLIVGWVGAQKTTDRVARIAHVREGGFIAVCKPATATTNTATVSPKGQPGKSTFPVEIKYPGDVIGLPVSDDLAAAMVGQDFGGSGVLHIITRDSNGFFSVHGTYTTPGTGDFVGVAYSSATSRLYLLDGLNKRIVWANYTVGDLPPTTWTVLASQAQVPILGSISNGQMWLDKGQDGPEPTLYMRTVSPAQPGGWLEDLHKVKHSSSGPVATVRLGELGRVAYFAEREFHGLNAGDTTVHADSGPAGAIFELLNVDDPANPVVLGSATSDSSGAATITTAPLVFGSVFGLRTSVYAEHVGPYSSCVKKWGTPDPLDNGSTIGLMPDLGLMSYVGHQFFRVPLLIVIDPAQVVVPTNYNVTLVVGTVADPVIDVDPPNGRWVLLGSSGFPTTARIFDANRNGFGGVEMPIPNDAGLANAELRFQWWVTMSPTDIRISDVQAVAIRGSLWVPPGAEDYFEVGLPLAAHGGSSAKTPKGRKRRKIWKYRAVDAKKSVAVVRKWLNAAKGRGALPWHDRNFKRGVLKAIRSNAGRGR